MKLAIIGGRSFNNFEEADKVFNSYFKDKIVEIVSGGAKGADTIGKRLAEKYNIPIKEFLPDWEKFGRSAGIRRNNDIIGEADVVLCFWDGQSKGSAHALSVAKKEKKPSFVIYY